ncbi:MAG TPA: Pr6Pr family membrane protein [Candidatus Saccharimonadia bacterium]|nr:Pr6Pr family membrane protein [Candidatus Saccharimonadia bacterium]
MVKNKNFLVGYKLLFGLLGISAIVTEIATIVERGVFKPLNFFSFFTVQNNILVFATFLLSTLVIAVGKNPPWLDKLRGATTMYIAVVGIGFAVLLSGLENTVLTAVPWDNIVLHYIIPIAAVVDLLVDKPKTTLHFRQSLKWLLYPIAYVLYSLIRGAITGWYPYPFLDPSRKGYVSIVITSFALLALCLGLTWIVCKLSGSKPRITKN